jgi:integrase
MALKTALKKFTGVYYTESKMKKWRDRPDRCYWVGFKDARTRKLIWERCGWASEGWTPEAAQRRRYELLEQDRTGDYKPKNDRKADQLTFGELMDKHYLPWAEHNKRSFRDDDNRYKNWLETRYGNHQLNIISPLDLERLKKEMKEAGKSPATITQVLCLVRQAFNKANQWRLWTGINPTKAVSFPRKNNERQRFLTPGEADKLLQALEARSVQLAEMATLSLYGGLRLGEIFALMWCNVVWEAGILHILDSKNEKSRSISITDPIKKVLEETTPGAPDEPIFKTRSGKTKVWLSKTFKGVVDSIGLNKGITDRREKVCFHSLRHTFASWAVMAGIPLYMVGKTLGHKTAVMTQRYAHLAPESHRSVFEAVANAQKNGKKQNGAGVEPAMANNPDQPVNEGSAIG